MTQRFRPGERIPGLPAGLLNDAADLIDRVKRMPEGPGFQGLIAGPRSYLPVRLQNLTGGDVVQCGVLGIGEPLVDPDDFQGTINDGFTMGGETPVVATHGLNFAVALEPIADHRVGWCCLVGWTWCKINVADAGHALARIDDADATRLASIASGEGIPIAWKQTGTGEKWGIVSLGAAAGSSGGGSLTHTEVTVVTDVRVDTTSLTIDVKTRTVKVVEPGTESGWTTIHTGTDCS